ncbi:tetratricopeptide repeat protein [Tenacibaculum sp. UWU-22]|uniref:tetratricopeptide repeat protein n=1 Tax=Tenacibaculum sp. UWU-22 TaxID=3234187 RepID=UPI0034DB24BC
MKKQILILTLVFMSFAAIAQKKELKAAEKAIKQKNIAGAIAAITSAESLVKDMDSDSKAKFYFLKGQAYAAKKDYKTAAEAFENLKKVEKKSKYTKQAQPIANGMLKEVSDKALKLYNEQKDYSNAAKKFYLAYLLSPKDTVYAFNAALSATQGKDYDNALKYYNELKKIGYTGITTEYLATNKETGKVENIGSKTSRDLMVKSGKYIKPETKKSESKKGTIVKNIALILKEQGKNEEAVAAVKEARKEDPNDMGLLLTEADLYIQLKQMDKFKELMQEGIEKSPNNPTLYFNLGVINYNQGNTDDAEKYYKKAIELKPDYADAYENLGIAILNKEKAIVDEMNQNLTNASKYDELEKQQKSVYKEALPYLEKADNLKRNAETVRVLSNIYSSLEMESKAKEYRDIYNSMK